MRVQIEATAAGVLTISAILRPLNFYKKYTYIYCVDPNRTQIMPNQGRAIKK